jgi:hypothetical protein
VSRPTSHGLALALVVAVLAPVAIATAVVARDLDDRLARSLDAFVGEVTSLRVERLADAPWTIVRVTVSGWLRSGGSDVTDADAALAARPVVELAFYGGALAGLPSRQVAGMPTYGVGERVLFLTYGEDTGYASPLVGFDQGAFRLSDGSWRDAAGDVLGLDANRLPVLAPEDAVADPAPTEADLMAALAERLAQLGLTP